MSYSQERRESVLRKLLPPDAQSVAQVSTDEGISKSTLFKWRMTVLTKGQSMPDRDKPADKWSSEEKFMIVLESASLNETELAKYCRKQGVFSEQIAQWREACMGANAPSDKAPQLRSQHDVRKDKKKIQQLTKELSRKERALAETAALLVLRKKANAIWGSGEDE